MKEDLSLTYRSYYHSLYLRLDLIRVSIGHLVTESILIVFGQTEREKNGNHLRRGIEGNSFGTSEDEEHQSPV